jgi:hypothetical protein
MEQDFKLEIVSLFERGQNEYTAIMKFLEGDDETEEEYINYGGIYIDLLTGVKWDVSVFRAFLGAKAHSKKLRMIGLNTEEVGVEPYKGMTLEKAKK